MVCQLGQGQCRHCVLRSACPYPAIFEGLAPPGREMMRLYQNVPQPFVLVVPGLKSHSENSSMLTWGVRLFGQACNYWPYLVHVYHTVGQRGLGKRRVPYRLRVVTDRISKRPVWFPDRRDVQPPTIGNLSDHQKTVPEQCTLRWVFSTPVRFSLHSGELSGLDLVLAGRRRLKIMNYFYGQQSEQEPGQSEERLEAAEFTTLASHIRPWRLQRYSARQGRKMSLYGLLGKIVIRGPWGRSGPWLQAVPLLHLGKATSFGFGRVTWEVI